MKHAVGFLVALRASRAPKRLKDGHVIDSRNGIDAPRAVARWTLPQCGGQRDDRRSLAISRQMLIAGLIPGRIGRWPI